MNWLWTSCRTMQSTHPPRLLQLLQAARTAAVLRGLPAHAVSFPAAPAASHVRSLFVEWLPRGRTGFWNLAPVAGGQLCSVSNALCRMLEVWEGGRGERGLFFLLQILPGSVAEKRIFEINMFLPKTLFLYHSQPPL